MIAILTAGFGEGFDADFAMTRVFFSQRKLGG